MPVTILVGAQWGDEGKGKITDLLARESDFVARYQGGNNAGHTVVVGGQTFRLHHIPSGILYRGVTCILGNGMVINPGHLLEEMDSLASRGADISPERLKISGKAHLIMPYHIALDGAGERAMGQKAIGTTRRGIGPAYADKAARRGLRAQDMLEEDFPQKVREAVMEKNIILEKLYSQLPLDAEAVAEEFSIYAGRLRPYIADVSLLLDEACRAGKAILCEGAQGTLLDIDHGTYPYVTSSSPAAGGALTGLGLGPKCVERVIGVVKAYQTRVGSGPFPTELHDEIGDRLVEVGHEYGTTTGRRRRTGWLDMVALRYAARINGLSELAITKLDVLGGIGTLKICLAYRCRGELLEHFPASPSVLEECEPVYEEMPGWKEDIAEAKKWDDLPSAAQNYIRRIETLAGLRATFISVGPEREQIIRV
ncbi:MAG: adenylosuccinate synthase [Anaerolineae bacterium]